MSVFVIQANIGAGKTSLLQQLKTLTFEKPHVILFEQVDEWTKYKDKDGNDILNLFYKDQEKYSYVFQTYVLFSRISYMLKTIKENPNSIIICERCHLTDLYVFAQSLYEQGKLTDIEINTYKLWHGKLRDMFNIKISGVIYLKTVPETCLTRIHLRSRTAENTIGIEYLEHLHRKHEEWLSDRPKLDRSVEYYKLEKDQDFPVLTIDGNVDIYNYPERTKQLEKIVKFINDESN